jgi:quercetin dioxygenase-like cupin family protein
MKLTYASGIVAFAAHLFTASLVSAGGELVREELSRNDLSGADNLEVIVARLEIQSGATVPKHTHNGDEHIIVLQGGDLETVDGKTISFTSGATVHFPEGTVHGGLTPAGDETIIIYTTHIVEKGKPLNNLVE